ncbi:protein translocase subunit SecD [Thiomonas sp. FB-Cd]|uniref:protein translocase subunit SecD n=1 Tax=Thiomonas sp. FB-Cd TaxID=1158292 RepID=UPI0004DF6C5D|nr:protein translocase subunit SecD [Thiomonas sp. FB-Cd]
MNRYPLWKYLIMAAVLVVGFVYALPNFYGEAPAVQITSAHPGRDLPNATLLNQGTQALKVAGIEPVRGFISDSTLNFSFATTEIQLKARDVLAHALNPNRDNPNYIVAVNLLSLSPAWLTGLHAFPMYLGLDLRGGVHFLLQVDMQAAIQKKLDSIDGELKSALRDKDVRYTELHRVGDTVQLDFRDPEMFRAAQPIVKAVAGDSIITSEPSAAGGGSFSIKLSPQTIQQTETYAIKQNITTLHNRINELGVAEPVIQQQGSDRVVVELPGIQDTARAKDILGRTASLEVRMVDDSPEAQAALVSGGPAPAGDQKLYDRSGNALMVKKDVLLTGQNLTDAQTGFDPQNNQPAVFLTLDSRGSRIFRDVTRANIGKRTAMVLIDRHRAEVVTAPVIRSEIAGGRVQISGSMTVPEANDIALLLRAGALAAPMQIIEERTVGPSLGQQNIAQGFHSVTWGFLAIVAFMCVYYMLFGAVSSIALAVNLMLLIALLSMLQATLTLPGIAAMALALGMAIDSNVLINERIREELRNGANPQAAIATGYERAWATILDSNVTTLIAGLALLIFGSGAVRGFAVVHVLGILTSMFSAVFFSRGLVNLWYGRKRRLQAVSIGQIWKPEAVAVKSSAKR